MTAAKNKLWRVLRAGTSSYLVKLTLACVVLIVVGLTQLPLARGGFLVALKSGLPIITIGLEGPRLVLPPGEGVIRPRPVTVRIGAAVTTDGVGVSRLRELMASTRRRIDGLRGPSGHVPDTNGDDSPTVAADSS